jgi:hypothetical protein
MRSDQETLENFENAAEAFRLLDLINTEFQNDPMSVQCLDPRIVQQVKECVQRQKEFVKRRKAFVSHKA